MMTYRDLIVWQKSMNAVIAVYEIAKDFPKEEDYSLSVQIRRAAVSIPSNIAEGYGRQTTNEYKRFLRIARGSVYELQTQLEIALRNSFIKEESFRLLDSICSEISKMLNSLIIKIK